MAKVTNMSVSVMTSLSPYATGTLIGIHFDPEMSKKMVPPCTIRLLAPLCTIRLGRGHQYECVCHAIDGQTAHYQLLGMNYH